MQHVPPLQTATTVPVFPRVFTNQKNWTATARRDSETLALVDIAVAGLSWYSPFGADRLCSFLWWRGLD